MKKMIRIGASLVALGLIGWMAWFWHHKQAPPASYNAVAVTRGDVVAVIGATGTVEPEEVVDVGSQVAGRILAFGTDLHGKQVDYGSEVEADTVLARIDDSIYASEAAQAAAQLQQAQAGAAVAEANLTQLQAKRDQAQRDWERARLIGPSEALAQSSYDAYNAAALAAGANVAGGEAAILQARAAVAQAESAVSRARLNLEYCVIKAPVKGVIIDRRVNIGQTVVASLNAPSLFLIAKDLKRMQLWIAVNEADIGNIKPGQPVTFTVDAYPGETFKGEVGKVRLNAAMTQNVVTYTVEVVTDNSSGRLLPYLTANAQVQVDHHENVLIVPNTALRWTPSPEQIAPGARQESGGGDRSSNSADVQGKGRGKGRAEMAGASPTRGTVWVQDGNFVRPVGVRIGISDGTMTEVQGDKLAAGTEVVVSEMSAGGRDSRVAGMKAGSGTNTNPFVPQMPARRR